MRLTQGPSESSGNFVSIVRCLIPEKFANYICMSLSLALCIMNVASQRMVLQLRAMPVQPQDLDSRSRREVDGDDVDAMSAVVFAVPEFEDNGSSVELIELSNLNARRRVDSEEAQALSSWMDRDPS